MKIIEIAFNQDSQKVQCHLVLWYLLEIQLFKEYYSKIIAPETIAGPILESQGMGAIFLQKEQNIAEKGKFEKISKI